MPEPTTGWCSCSWPMGTAGRAGMAMELMASSRVFGDSMRSCARRVLRSCTGRWSSCCAARPKCRAWTVWTDDHSAGTEIDSAIDDEVFALIDRLGTS
jgi:hypothetical protein